MNRDVSSTQTPPRVIAPKHERIGAAIAETISKSLYSQAFRAVADSRVTVTVSEEGRRSVPESTHRELTADMTTDMTTN